MEVPKFLSDKPNWILWRDEIDAKGDHRKVPYQTNGLKAKTNGPETWTTYENALAHVAGYSGIGFVFDGEGCFGIDIDGCINPATKKAEPWAHEILDKYQQTYAEVSPSGKGIKIFAGGDYDGPGRKKELNHTPCSDRKPGLEVYGIGRYFTVTGIRAAPHPLAIADCKDQLAETLNQHWPIVRPAYSTPPPTPHPLDITDRIRKYLATVPGAVSGSHGHDQTFRVACTLVLGFNLGPEQAYPFFAEWNQTCEPPWSDKDLWYKLGQADKKEGHRGKLLEDDRSREDPEVDLSHIMSLATTPAEVVEANVIEPPDDIPPDPHALPVNPETIPGLVGDIVRHNLATALFRQPQIALAGALALLATITGRKVEDPSRTRTNLYILGLAPSGSGKDHARKLNKELLLRAGAEKMIGPERIGSSAGLARCVRDQPAILFQLDEIARLLETTKSSKSSHLWNVPTVLLQLYNSSNCLWIGDAYAKAEQTPKVNQPHAVVYGTCPAAPFWQAMTHENVTEGLLGRFLPFESGYELIQRAHWIDTPDEIVEAVKWWINLNPAGDLKTPGGNLSNENPKPLIFKYTPDAQDRIDGHNSDITNKRVREDPARAAMWSRTLGTTAKLALLFACSEGISPDAITPQITLQHVEAAIRISNWATRRMLRMVFEYVAANEWEKESKKILRLVMTPMTQNDLTRKTQNLKPREREEIVRGLIQAGLVEIVEEKTAGRSRKVIRQARYLSSNSPLDERGVSP